MFSLRTGDDTSMSLELALLSSGRMKLLICSLGILPRNELYGYILDSIKYFIN